MASYAIVETGGKQYKVSEGDHIAVEKLPGDKGDEIRLDRVLLVSKDGAVQVGKPTVEGASVLAKVQRQDRDRKIIVFKYKPKKRYRRKQGHRQAITRLVIQKIEA